MEIHLGVCSAGFWAGLKRNQDPRRYFFTIPFSENHLQSFEAVLYRTNGLELFPEV